MVSRNDITGDAIRTGSSSDAFRDGWERIFGKKTQPEKSETADTSQEDREIYHLRSYGDVSKEDLDGYIKAARSGRSD